MKTVIITLLACVTLAGCNTIAGVGEDITGIAGWAQSSMGGGY